MRGVADLRRAREFVEATGDELERARAAALADGDPARPEALAEVAKAQTSDGGWPAFWSGGRSSLDATCFRLAQLEDVAPAGDELAGRALAFLASRQLDDGGWQEAEPLAGSPPLWVAPGDEAARLWASEDGAAFDAQATLAAIRALR